MIVELIATFFILPVSYDSYGGWTEIQGNKTGYFHVEQIDGVWWLIDPDGNGFISKGVNHISSRGDHSPKLGYSPYARTVERKYGSAEKWAQAVIERLREWNFNTVGAWSSGETFRQKMPYTLILGLGARAGASWEKGTFIDVFSDSFSERVREIASRACADRKDDPYLIGYFVDNELHWGPDWRSTKTLLEDYMAFPNDAPGKRKLIEFLRSRYDSVDDLNRAWGIKIESFEELNERTEFGQHKTEQFIEDARAFLKIIAEKYFQVCDDAIREYDPNHLNLGCRFAGYAPRPVLEAMVGHVDVVSFNNYDFKPPLARIGEIHEITGVPVMITEFSFKAMDSGLPNTRGAGQPVQTQQERADCFEKYVVELMKQPFVVGYHWFEHADEPAEGRFDGENSNYGVVDIEDNPWEILTKRMRKVNSEVEAIHAGR